MAKKLKKFPFLFRPSDATGWPCVTSLRTLSFRADSNASLYTTTINTTSAGDPPSLSPSLEATETGGVALAAGLRSDDRLFFVEPGETNSILEEAKSQSPCCKCKCKLGLGVGGVGVLSLDSRDPFLDFRVSMEEMVEAHGLQDWQCLEELLTCYLIVNGKNNHGYIVGAFVDLLLKLNAVASDIDGGGGSASTSGWACTGTQTQESCGSHISLSASSKGSIAD